MRQARILGAGMYLPERVIANADLEVIKELDTSDEWIQQRSGIKTRRYVSAGESGVDLAVHACKQAVENAGLTMDDIDFIVYATLSPDYTFPGNGCFLQERLCGERTIGAMDVRNQCSGFIYGLAAADSFIKTGLYDHILLVGTEVQSTGLDFTRNGRDVTVLFGDGAGAVVVGPAPEGHPGIMASALHAEGKFARELWTEAPASLLNPRISHELLDQGRHYAKMNGRVVFKHAVTRMVEVSHEVLAKAGRKIADVALFLPHQANLRINQMVASYLGIPPERMVNTIEWTGNTTAATIPICMCEAIKQGKLRENDLVLLTAFGSGFTWASTLLAW
ncbi:MAG TPA: beta-ketoacyl-ACP synthase III [Syntrophobacteria bacterium]|nr:beta-ketoacyl-ACP synthase III [Syntrophobacteria bacterium]